MSKTTRLFKLMTALRKMQAPVTAARLSDELHVSLRTIYRDIDTLRAIGAVIDGEAGFGFTLIEDASLPPLAFEDDELEALVLGLREVAEIGDPSIADAARAALAKITARVPDRQAHRLEHAVLDARRFVSPPRPSIDVAQLRQATWDEIAIFVTYFDASGAQTKRKLWPLGIVYLETSSVLMAWCHLRQDYRTFRLDRIKTFERTSESFRPRRVMMLRDHIARLRKDLPSQDQNRL
ncbi:MAG: helix-turn-helix transcriptional regulator [Paracoccaceae bacterium]